MRRIILVRHAHHDRLDHVLCGRMSGVSLSERGREQAWALAVRLSGTGASQVLSSPRERARETAGPIADGLGLPVATEAALDEIDFGEWTGRHLDRLDDDPGWEVWNIARSRGRPPGGESSCEVRSRVAGLIDRLGAVEDAPVILVSHGDVIRAAVLHLLGLDLDAYDRIVVAPASFSELALWPGGGRVVSLNERAAP